MGLKHITTLVALVAPSALAVNPLKVSGSNFVDSVTGDRFQIIGVDYQPGGSAGFIPQNKVDPLSNGTTCLRDAIVMQSLGLNAIRVYNLDSALNHDDCASIFNAAGIYMIIDVNTPLPNQSIDAADPGDSYNSVYLEYIFSVVEAFKNYDNLIGFFSGNEIVNDMPSAAIDPPYIRAVTRDLKNYIAKHSKRTIPVGYSAADVRPVLVDTSSYLQCALNGDDNDPSRIDFFGLNSYSWCGDATFETSGYNVLTEDFSNTTVPVFFSEYGCNTPSPRVFNEVQSLYGQPMSGVYSGGLVYEWTQEANNFGIVQVNDNSTISLRTDFDNLQSQLNKLDLQQVMAQNSTATSRTPVKCDASLISDSGLSTNFTLPDTPSDAQGYISNGVSGVTPGALKPVTATSMPMPVYGSNGEPITGLKLKIISDGQSNTPNGGHTTQGGGSPSDSNNTTSSSGGTTSSSSSGLASVPTANVIRGAGAIAVGLVGVMLL